MRVILWSSLLIPMLSCSATAQDLYAKPGLSCDPTEVGVVGGPISLSDDALVMPGLSCRLSGRSSVHRMNADLVDAACPQGGKTHQSRLFINLSDDGVTIISREFGVFVFDSCG